MAKKEKNWLEEHAPELAALAVGGGTYAAMRKFRPSTTNAALRKLQEASEAGGITMSLRKELKPGLLDRIGFGIPINKPKQAVVYQHMQESAPKTWEKFQRGEGVTKEFINPSETSIKFNDKANFADIMNKERPDAIPRSVRVSDLDVPSGVAIENALNTKDYLVKPDFGALEKVSDFANRNDFVTGSAKAKRILKEPQYHVAQEKLDIDNEYRVHMLDGEIYGVHHRYLPGKMKEWYNNLAKKLDMREGGGAGILPVISGRDDLVKFAKENLAPVVEKYQVPGTHTNMAFDIVKTKDGQFKVLEAQPGMGTFNSPLVNRKFNRLATGRWGRDVSAGAGALTGGSTYGLVSAMGGNNEQR